MLIKLTEFITGKSRLPHLLFGEDKINIIWNGNKSFPTSQNCNNTLIMPNNINISDGINSISKSLNCIYRFNTSFGYL